MIGKVAPEALAEHVLDRTGADDADVIQGPAYGEDTAAISLGDQILVVNSDPLSLAAEEVGTLAVHVVCNDLAASGARPRWMTNTMFLPDDDPTTVDNLTRQLDDTATKIGVAIVGGHSEYLPPLDRPLLSLTSFGLTDRYVPSGGAQVGDAIVLTGTAAIEGTAILATDFAEDIREHGVEQETIDRGASFIDEISVIEEGELLRHEATGMHDPTEGGILTGLIEMARAAENTFEIDEASIPVRPETQTLCSAMDVDPLWIFGSGSMLATVPQREVDEVLDRLTDNDIRGTEIGRVRDGQAGISIGGDLRSDALRDELYALWA